MNFLQNKFRLIFLSICFVIASSPIYAQTGKWHSKFSFEIGAGYNTSKSKVKFIYLNKDTVEKRNALWIQPAARLSYNFQLSKKDSTRFILTPFVGFYIFGGKTKTAPSGYKDILIFNSIEAGIIPSVRICKRLQVGLGFKGQYILSVKEKYYGVLNQPDSIPQKWGSINYSNDYFSFACNAGLQVKYHIKKITIAAEGWYGLSNLFSLNITAVDLSARVTENNFRLMLGYDF